MPDESPLDKWRRVTVSIDLPERRFDYYPYTHGAYTAAAKATAGAIEQRIVEYHTRRMTPEAALLTELLRFYKMGMLYQEQVMASPMPTLIITKKD